METGNEELNADFTKRVLVLLPYLGIASMAVCAVKDATDQEILEVANKENPLPPTALAAIEWSKVRRDLGKSAFWPHSCMVCAGRKHFQLEC